MNYMEIAANQAADLIGRAYREAVHTGALANTETPAIPVEVPKDTKNGDYSSSFALTFSGVLRCAPRKIAEQLVKYLSLEGSFFERAEIAGPGFINLFLCPSFFAAVLRNVMDEGPDFGRLREVHPEKIMVEFVSANPTGPMHMGNARGGVIGDCLAEVLSRAGHDVTREFYVNDAGNQVELFSRSLEARYINHLKGEDAVPFPEDGYHGDDVRALAAEFADIHGRGYLDADEDTRRKALCEFALLRNIEHMKEDLSRYRIFYDRWLYESELHRSGFVEETMALLKARGCTYEKDGALWLKTSDFGCDKDDVLMRSNGLYTYFAVDIAYHREKFEKRGFDRVINIWGADHHGHVARLKAALDALGLDGSNRLEILLMQLVNLMRDGETVRMSKRTGQAITLSDLLDEVSTDAARFFFNFRSADTHLDFDLGLAVRQDSENPVYYVQYAHARISSILKNLDAAGVILNPESDLTLLSSKEEIALIKEISKLPEEVHSAAISRDPTMLDKYAVDIAAAFHKFYTACRITDAEIDLRDARIILALATKTVIANTLSIIGVEAPEHM